MSQPSIGRLSPDLYEALHGLKSIRVFSKGTTLFRRGIHVAGVFVVESGNVRVVLPGGDGGSQLLGVAGPGTILGLTECMSGEDYRVTAQADDHVIASFVRQESFLEFLRSHGEFCMEIVRLLSEDLHSLYYRFRKINARPGRPRRRQLDEFLN